MDRWLGYPCSAAAGEAVRAVARAARHVCRLLLSDPGGITSAARLTALADSGRPSVRQSRSLATSMNFTCGWGTPNCTETGPTFSAMNFSQAALSFQTSVTRYPFGVASIPVEEAARVGMGAFRDRPKKLERLEVLVDRQTRAVECGLECDCHREPAFLRDPLL